MAFCANCGATLNSDSAFCPSCGRPVQAAGNTASGTMVAVSGGRVEFSEAVRMRSQADRIMSVGWIFLPLVGIVLGLVGVALDIARPFAGIGFTAVFSLVDLVLVVAFWYFLISRRNNHFRRDKLERQGLIDYIKQQVSASGMPNQVDSELATMNAINGEANAQEQEKSAVLWIILSIVTFGIAGLYVLYFLTRDPYNHDKRQQSFMQQAQTAFEKLGKTVVNPSWKALPSRSFVLYLIISIVTFGIFEFYWYYSLITDFNNHFKAQWQLEDSMLAVM